MRKELSATVNVSGNSKSIKFGFNYMKPGTLIESFEFLLKHHNAKDALEVTRSLGGAFVHANDVLFRYYRARCLDALQDVAAAHSEAMAVGAVADGITDSDVPELDDKGRVRIPKQFLDRFPDARALRDAILQRSRDSAARFDPQFVLGGEQSVTSGLDKRVAFGAEHGRFDYWPVGFAKRQGADGEFSELDRIAVAGLLIDDIMRRVLPPDLKKRSRNDAVVATFGSCFAVNLARSLDRQGVRCDSFRVEEVVNTTRANHLLLDYILFGRETETDFFSRTISPEQRESISGCIRSASIIVLTVGVSPVVEWKGTGKLCITDRYKELFESGEVVQRFTSVDENKENIVSIVGMIRQINPAADIFLSLSPVPLLGVADGSSVVMRDALSKSTLRLAIEEASKECSFIYWPAFEVVKWIAPHTENALRYQAYGEDDQNSRHVSRWLIDIICSKFIDYVFKEQIASQL